jgi:dolichol-phosphate mannosyltransferase
MTTIETTIVIPAYKERANFKPLIERINAHLSSSNYLKHEIIIVDDNSQDGTIEEIESLKHKHKNITLITRTTERGLSSAVIRGFREAKGSLLICMDADLQHPPENLIEMINELKKSEFVIGTRYLNGALTVDKDWPLHRLIISKGARLLAYPLTSLTDPMTGYFGVRKPVFESGKVSGVGFKIAMEIFVKCGVKTHGEVPIVFGVRTEGESKLTGKVITMYLKHLSELYLFKYPAQLLVFFALVSLFIYSLVWYLLTLLN